VPAGSPDVRANPFEALNFDPVGPRPGPALAEENNEDGKTATKGFFPPSAVVSILVRSKGWAYRWPLA
jgi:hypothetical protein